MKQTWALVLAWVVAALLTSAVPAAGQSKGLASALHTMHAGVARNVVEAAEQMPEADYAYMRLKGMVPPSTARTQKPPTGAR